MPSKRYFCPVDVTLSLIEGKWQPLILSLLKERSRRFGALQASLPHVSHKVLTQQLRGLERNGLVERGHQMQTKVVTYRLTEFGRTLRPVLTALAAWGMKHHQALGYELVWPPRASMRETDA